MVCKRLYSATTEKQGEDGVERGGAYGNPYCIPMQIG